MHEFRRSFQLERTSNGNDFGRLNSDVTATSRGSLFSTPTRTRIARFSSSSENGRVSWHEGREILSHVGLKHQRECNIKCFKRERSQIFFTDNELSDQWSRWTQFNHGPRLNKKVKDETVDQSLVGCAIMREWQLTEVGNAFFRFEIRQRRRRRINFRSPLRKAPSWGADNPSASTWEVFGDYWSFMSHINMAKVVDILSNSTQWPEYSDLKSSLCFISLLLCPINLKMSKMGNFFT